MFSSDFDQADDEYKYLRAFFLIKIHIFLIKHRKKNFKIVVLLIFLMNEKFYTSANNV